VVSAICNKLEYLFIECFIIASTCVISATKCYKISCLWTSISFKAHKSVADLPIKPKYSKHTISRVVTTAQKLSNYPFTLQSKSLTDVYFILESHLFVWKQLQSLCTLSCQ
jgi:hypothetical protein